MKKLVSILLTLAVAVSLGLLPAVSSAASPPTIDGVVTIGEWDGATVIDVADAKGTVSVIAETDYLYVLFEVLDSDDARLGQTFGNDQTSININPTAGAPWGLPCEIIFQMGADPAAWGGASSGPTDNWETDWEIDGEQLSLPGDLDTMTLYDGTTRISEWKIPLASINPSPGDTLKVGGAIDVGDQASHIYPIGLDWGDVSTYVDVLVQGNTAVSLTAETPTIIAINVDPTSIDFGTVNPGDVVPGPNITVENIGTVKVSVDASLDPLTGTVFNYLKLNGVPSPGYGGDWADYIISGLKPSLNHTLTTVLDVPPTYTAQGSEATTLIFEATAV